jgi:hypothetical protein
VGRRLTLFRRLATDDAPRVMVASARSLIQPIAPGLGALDPVRLPDRVSQEGVVAAVTGGDDTPGDERTVTGVLPEWNGPAAGMA